MVYFYCLINDRYLVGLCLVLLVFGRVTVSGQVNHFRILSTTHINLAFYPPRVSN